MWSGLCLGLPVARLGSKSAVCDKLHEVNLIAEQLPHKCRVAKVSLGPTRTPAEIDIAVFDRPRNVARAFWSLFGIYDGLGQKTRHPSALPRWQWA